MMSGRVISLILLASSACALAGGGETDTRPIVGAWTGEVRALGEAGHSGFATVTVFPAAGTRANLTLSGGSPGGRHPWQIREGDCGEEGDVVGSPGDYPLLEPDQAGQASASVTLATDLDADGSYSVEVLQAEDDETVVGCGDLVASG